LVELTGCGKKVLPKFRLTKTLEVGWERSWVSLPQRGRDKLTLVTSPSINSFGLWVEQFNAESTGKVGMGIVPVAGEPLGAPNYYGDDRVFVYLRLDGDHNDESDKAVGAI
jgi:glucose-6-phosphate isomerase